MSEEKLERYDRIALEGHAGNMSVRQDVKFEDAKEKIMDEFKKQQRKHNGDSKKVEEEMKDFLDKEVYQ